KEAAGWKDKRQHLLGPTLEAAIAETLSGGGQVILLLNRRGYSGHIACTDPKCGFVLGCDDCDARLVYHKFVRMEGSPDSIPPRAIVRCHHCLASTLLPQTCPLCQRKLFILAQGTQRLEEEVQAKFAQHLANDDGTPAWARVDSDTMRSG